jgi:hypothetical protein
MVDSIPGKVFALSPLVRYPAAPCRAWPGISPVVIVLLAVNPSAEMLARHFAIATLGLSLQPNRPVHQCSPISRCDAAARRREWREHGRVVLRIVAERKWLDALEERGYLGPLDRGSRADGNHTGKIQIAPSRFDRRDRPDQNRGAISIHLTAATAPECEA